MYLNVFNNNKKTNTVIEFLTTKSFVRSSNRLEPYSAMKSMMPQCNCKFEVNAKPNIWAARGFRTRTTQLVPEQINL